MPVYAMETFPAQVQLSLEECSNLLRRSETESSKLAYATCRDAARSARKALDVYPKWKYRHQMTFIPESVPYSAYCRARGLEYMHLGTHTETSDRECSPVGLSQAFANAAHLLSLAIALNPELKADAAQLCYRSCRRYQGEDLMSKHRSTHSPNAFAAQASLCFRAAQEQKLSLSAESRNMRTHAAKAILPDLPELQCGVL